MGVGKVLLGKLRERKEKEVLRGVMELHFPVAKGALNLLPGKLKLAI